ncbi:MAG: helix-turn-helix domain-containing protein [Actinobacteria bacterium]|nr:helix-turn-helix domain-containing protein [Actinomycetota bacterium]
MILLGIINYFKVKMIANYYNVEEAAEILRVKKITIRRWCKSGLLNAKKIGKKWLIEEDELNLFKVDDVKIKGKS